MGANLKMLAAQLGLSPTTVSRALGGYSDVSAATRERVLTAAREIGYQPNRAARQIATGRADAVGIVHSPAIAVLGNPSFLETLDGAQGVLAEAGLDLLVLPAARQAEMQTYDRLVRGRRVDVVIVVQTLRDDHRIDYLQASEFPFIAYGRTREPGNFPWFDFDNEAGSWMAVRELITQGHERIAYVHAPLTFNHAWQRHKGFVDEMGALGLDVSPHHVVGNSMDRRSGYAAAQQLLALNPRPTAILVDNHMASIGVIGALFDAKVQIGTELSVVVNEGMPADTLFGDFTFASVSQPTPFLSGQTLGQMARDLIEGKLDELSILRQPVFVPGDSLGPSPD